MLQAMATWRTEHEVDKLLDGFEFHELPLVRKHYPHFYHKTDKYGRPVYIELLGQCDIDQLLKVRQCVNLELMAGPLRFSCSNDSSGGFSSRH